MTPHTAILSGPHSPRAFAEAGRPNAPVLIRVPTLRPSRSARVTAPRGRRRLRREVRVAASTLLLVLPMSWALFAFPKIGSSPDAAIGDSGRVVATAPAPIHPNRSQVQAVADADDAPQVTIGLNTTPVSSPPSTTSTPEPDAPIVAPAGYLVPDESPEEASHEGR